MSTSPEPTPQPSGWGHSRKITRRQYDTSVQWVRDQHTRFATMTCAEKVLAVVGSLIYHEDGYVNGTELAAAIREPDTVDAALDVLDEAGAPCA